MFIHKNVVKICIFRNFTTNEGLMNTKMANFKLGDNK